MHRVMILTSALYQGGAERVIAHLARHLNRSRFQVTVAHLKERGAIGDELASTGFDVVAIDHRRRGLRRYLSFGSLTRVVRERGIDLLHTHTTYSLTDAALCRAATLGRVKLVHTFHYGNYPNLPGRYVLMERLASRGANRLVAVGAEQMNALRSLYGFSSSAMTVIPNGIDSPAPNVDQEWAARLAEDGRVVIGTTATFIEQKGLDCLLDLAQVLERDGTPAVFVVVGDGHLRQRLDERRRAMKLERRVLFAGMKHNASVTMTPLYDVLLQPSLWEAMSVVVLEAMAASKPVVVTDVGDNRHVVQDGATGFVVAPRDVPAMADRLKALVASQELRRQLGAAGRRRYEERYTVQMMTRGYEQVYDEVLGVERRE